MNLKMQCFSWLYFDISSCIYVCESFCEKYIEQDLDHQLFFMPDLPYALVRRLLDMDERQYQTLGKIASAGNFYNKV